MDEDTLRLLIESARAETSTYPAYATRLAQGGVDGYRVDVAMHTIDWLADGIGYREAGLPPIEAGTIAGAYTETEIVRALRRNQRGETDYPTFLREIWAAGVVAYTADLRSRTVAYHGATGESYLEAVPASA